MISKDGLPVTIRQIKLRYLGDIIHSSHVIVREPGEEEGTEHLVDYAVHFSWNDGAYSSHDEEELGHATDIVATAKLPPQNL